MTTSWTTAIQVGTVACVLAVAAEAAAATIFGFIHETNRPVVGRDVILNCSGVEAGKDVTDERGNYRITSSRTGRCRLLVGRASGDVVLYTEPTRYNFEIVGERLIRR
jgi:hypothetical protein